MHPDFFSTKTFVRFPVLLFVLLAAVTIFFTREIFIDRTPGWKNFPDIRIYQGVGKTVLLGINAYDYSDHPDVRRKVRLEQSIAPDDFVTVSQGTWDHYLSANPPGSTMLYAVLERFAKGSRDRWRELFIAGDIAILLGLWALMGTLKGGLADGRRQVAVFCLAVLFPLLSLAVPFMSEDKQFQTALLLFGAALLLRPYRRSASFDSLTGFVLSFGAVFKLFGAILLPLWLAKAWQRPKDFAVWTIIGGCLPLLLSYWAFGAGPVTALLERGAHASTGIPSSGSPWQLLLLLGKSPLAFVRILVALVCSGGLLALFFKGRVDALNLSAGLGVVLGCLWLQDGSMDRMDIVIMFAMASVATLSTARFLWLTLLMTGLSAIAFVCKIPNHGVDQRIDGMLVAAFVIAYGATLLWRRNQSESPSRIARDTAVVGAADPA